MNIESIAAIILATSLAVAGCGTGTVVEVAEQGGSQTTSSKADRGSADDSFELAFDVLRDLAENGETELQRALAGETLARIEAGDVWIGPLSEARGLDLWHMCQDAMPGECGDVPAADSEWQDAELIQVVGAELDGYMWGDRLYFTVSESTDPRELAATLVHEVNHVLNRSECSYYSDIEAHTLDHELAYVEEYRAFLTECFLNGGAQATVEGCSDWAHSTLDEREYGLEPDISALTGEGSDPLPIAQSLFDDQGDFGWLVPWAVDWPTDFEPCW